MTAPEFFKQGKCVGHDTPDLFFTDDHLKYDAYVEEAKAICRGCPIRTPCFEYAYERPSMWGIWGASTTDERKELRKRKARAA